jgi:K+:H+ antiporter
MTADPLIFRDLSYVLVAAVLGGLLARALRQPLIVGFVVAGILISPFTPGPRVSDIHTFELLAEVGVVLLMFSIGMEFSLRDLLRVKWVALVGGPLGIALSVLLALGLGVALGWPPIQSAVIGIVTSVASTMVLVQLLLDRGDLNSPHGRVMIGIALVEDLAVVVLTVLLPALGALEPGRLLAIGEALLRAALVLIPFVYLAAKVVPRMMARVAATRSDELFLLVALAIGFGTAAITQAVGLSLALGAFLGGLLIGGSDYAHEALARLLPLRDVFVAFFFVTVGALIDPASVLSNPTLLVVIVGLVVVGKLVMRALVVRLFGYPLSVAILTGVGLSQIGEFSFVLVSVARDAGHVGADVYQAVLTASLISVFLNVVLERNAPDWIGSLRLRRAPGPEPAGPLPAGHVLLCGFGRVGSAIGEALETFHIAFAVVERDPDIIRELRKRKVPCLFGDAGDRRLLHHAGAASATLAIVALPEIGPAERAVRAIRDLNAEVPLLARAHGRGEAEKLQRLGATEVIQPEVEASATLIRHALATLGLPKQLALDYLDRFHRAMLTGLTDEAVAPGVLPVVHEVRLGGQALVDQSLRQARIRERFGVTVVAITRQDDDILFNPGPDTMLRSGDVVRVFGLPAQIDAFTAALERTDGRA